MMLLGLLGLEKIFGQSARKQLDREIQRADALGTQAAAQRESIDKSDRNKAETEMLKAGAQSARTNTTLDAWQSIVGSGTKSEDYTQKYFQGQQNRDFENPDKKAQTILIYGLVAFAGVFVVVLLLNNKK